MARIGVEWINVYPQNDTLCRQVNLPYSSGAAESFLFAMRSYGHDDIFDWGDDNAWSSDFDHPDFGGNSLMRSDNVHFCSFTGHGGQFRFEGKLAFNIGFSSRHNPPDLAPCRSMSPQWKLGSNRLKWFLLDSCDIVVNPTASEIAEMWFPPLHGLHLLLGFVGLQTIGPITHNRRISFAFDICRGVPIGLAWLYWSHSWDYKKSDPSRPIAIAAGATRDEAIARRDGETLGWLWYNVQSTNWLAWKWRG